MHELAHLNHKPPQNPTQNASNEPTIPVFHLSTILKPGGDKTKDHCDS